MPIDPAHVMQLALHDRPVRYTVRDTLLYAIALGFGRDPFDARERRFVYEGDGPVAVPTLAVPVSSLGLLAQTGVDMSGVVHLAQKLVAHKPLPSAAEMLVSARVTGLYDRGEGKGALLSIETHGRDGFDDDPLFTTTMTVLARKDGGFGGEPPPAPAPRPVFADAPDHVVASSTRPETALLYRLLGDWNKLHVDVDFARRSGFDRPILHGLATYGIAARALLLSCDDDEARLRDIEARFSAVVFPGDEVVTELWRGAGMIHFRCRVPARDVIVLDDGKAVIA